MTMKMISRTSRTSISGVTLICGLVMRTSLKLSTVRHPTREKCSGAGTSGSDGFGSDRRQEGSRLQERLVIFVCRIAVDHDPAANIEDNLLSTDNHRPDRNAQIESRVINIPKRLRYVAPDRPHRQSTLIGFDRIYECHRSYLRRAGDRTTREDSAEDLREPDILSEPAADRRDEMKQRRMLLKLAKLFDGNAAELTDPSQVISHQVDHHRILGPVLFARAQFFTKAIVLDDRLSSPARAFDRRSFDSPVEIYAKETFG